MFEQICSLSFYEDVIVVRGHSPVLAMVVFIGVVLLVVGEEGVELQALLEILGGLEATDVLQHIKIAVCVGTGLNESMPMHTLKLDVGVVLLKVEVHARAEADVWSLDSVHVFTSHLELVKVEVFWEHLHFLKLIIIIAINNRFCFYLILKLEF